MFDTGRSYITRWKENHEEIAILFRDKKYRHAIDPMYKQLINFKQSLFLLNGYADKETSDLDIDSFEYKPFNVVDRLLFIEENRHQYHSYIQLNELFKELEKIYARAEIISKRNK